jgi:4-amino-4-deoxy-L-arabinose transferase-like glycosyltransferase
MIFNLKQEKTYVKVTLIIIMACFFCISVYSILRYGNYFLLGSLDKMNNDDVKYIRSAVTFLEKGILTYQYTDKATVFIMPGLTLILAPFIKFFGLFGGITAFRFFQALLQTLNILIIFFIAREIFNSKIALLSCIIDAIYIPEIYNAGTILTDMVFKFLLLLLIYVSICAFKSKQVSHYISCGVLLGLSCLFRPTIALYPLILFIMWLLYRYTFKEILKFTLIISTTLIIVMSPWWIRNYIQFDRFIPLTLSSGNPFLQATYINYDQTKNYTPLLSEPGNDEIKKNEIELATGKYRLKQYFKETPLQYIYWYSIGKSYHLFSVPFYFKAIFNISGYSAMDFHRLILFLGMVGMVFTIKKKNYLGISIVLTIVYFFVVHIPYFEYSRYAYPIMPLFIILSAYTILCTYNIVDKPIKTKYVPKVKKLALFFRN